MARWREKKIIAIHHGKICIQVGGVSYSCICNDWKNVNDTKIDNNENKEIARPLDSQIIKA